jgi:phosphoglycolate phosphatase
MRNPMKRISTVIFDCDGVMFDSLQANIHYYNSVLAHFEFPPMTEDQVNFIHMNTAEESIGHLFRKTPFVDQAQAYRMRMKYSPFIKDMVIEPGLKELLKMLKTEYGLAVATNRSDTIGEVLESNGLLEFFDIVVSSLDVQHPKPHPESIYKILDFFKISPEQCLYVGDSPIDWQTARAAGVPFVAYGNDELETPWKIKNILEIKDLLEN